MTTTSEAGLRGQRERWILAALVLAFLAVALTVEFAGDMPGDRWALSRMYDAFGTDLDDSMVAVGAATDTLPIAAAWLLVVAALLIAERRPEATLFLVTVVVAMGGNRLLKEIFARARPDVRPSPESTSTFSFPSGHGANTFALVGALFLVAPSALWRRRVLFFAPVFIVLVGFSRVAISVHYPSDIIASWLWVGAWLWVLWHRRRPSAHE